MKFNNIPLELDERIYDIEDIKTVITADEKDVGKMGYFANSIQNFKDLEGSRIYVALFPCNECAKAIIQSGIKEVVYISDKYKDT